MSGPSLPQLPALVVGSVHHARLRPFRYSFRHRHYSWLLDLDAPPRLPRGLRWLGTLRAQDHLGSPPDLPALKANVLRCLDRAGYAQPVARVLMLTHLRSLGHVFDPMTAYWCLGADGGVVAVLVEVHNTYGGRHAYVLDPDGTGRGVIDKDFYVSPFNDTAGRYAVALHLDAERVGVAIQLERDGERLLTASVSGRPRPATTAAVLATTLRHPLMTWRVSALIRVHGIRLWARRLPVQPRPVPSLESVR